MVKETILITGSSKGLGKALALKFSKEKYNIILHGRSKEDLDIVKKEILKNKVSCDVVIGDISDINTIENLKEIARNKRISILINNAAIMSNGLVENIKDNEVDEVLNINLAAIIKLTRQVYSYFLEKKSGMIINILSTGALNSSEQHSLYCASKYGLRGFTDCLRIEAKQKNIRVLGVYPAGMWTTFHNRVGGKKDITQTMKTEEVANIIFNLVGYGSVHISEILLERMYHS